MGGKASHSGVAGTLTPPASDQFCGEFASLLFASLRRKEQRYKAEQYVCGLLMRPGRKTLRNVAAQFGGEAAQQSVHHFIASSPWEWMPVRRALARCVHEAFSPLAWVIRPTMIPKAGNSTIGVDEHYVPRLGQAVNGQHAAGVWLTSDRSALPVGWRLLLSERWMEARSRRQAGVPEGAAAADLDACVRGAVDDVVETREVPRIPVVVDAELADSVGLARHLATLQLPFLVRVDPMEQLRLDPSRLPLYGGRERTAGELVKTLTHLRRAVNLGDGPTLAAAIPVVGRHRPAMPGGGGLFLVGEWAGDGRAGGRLWLTGSPPSALPQVLALTRLPAVVKRDFDAISESVGMTDFAGRSYQGWHRHVTLASVAHCIAAWPMRTSGAD
ncbi:transposase [Streptomyces sp. NPDC006261]|uniref:IS701 family transposase n=1 Tax=Streptomyces sp. NPDC006261 TaxID=3156739 RepID=UPI0033ACDDE1